MRYKKVSATQIAKYLVEVKTCWDRKYDYPVSTSWRHGRKFLDGLPRNSTGQKGAVLIKKIKHFWKKILTTATPGNRHELRLQCYGFNPCFLRPFCNLLEWFSCVMWWYSFNPCFLRPFCNLWTTNLIKGLILCFNPCFLRPFCN